MEMDTQDFEIIDLEVNMPPTLNKAYINTKKGRRLTTHAKKTKESITKLVSFYILKKDINMSLYKDNQMTLTVDYYFKEVENKGWPKKAKFRYKKVDISNRIKLLEDAIADAIGIGDENFFKLVLTKHKSENRQEKCRIRIKVE